MVRDGNYIGTSLDELIIRQYKNQGFGSRSVSGSRSARIGIKFELLDQDPDPGWQK
jgi:hypothetical protein